MLTERKYFTNHARWILQLTQDAAAELNQPEIRLEHLFIGMVRAVDTDAYLALTDFDIIEGKLMPFMKHKQAPSVTREAEDISLSDGVKEVLRLAVEASHELDTVFVAPAHLLIGLMNCPSQIVTDVLYHFDVEREAIKQQVIGYLRDDNPDLKDNTAQPLSSTMTIHSGMLQSLVDKVVRFFGFNRGTSNRSK